MTQQSTQPNPGAAPADDTPAEIHLVLRPMTTVLWRGVPWNARFKRLIKLALRSFGFKVEVRSYVDRKPEATHADRR